MMDEKFFIEKVRSIFDLDQRVELAKKILKEEFGVYPHYEGVEKNLTCERPYVRYAFSYFHGPDDIEWIFVGEDNDGIKYYVNFIEYEVREINPFKFFYKEWDGHKITDEHYPDMLVYEFCKDVERYGLTWRLYVRVGLYKEEKEENEE